MPGRSTTGGRAAAGVVRRHPDRASRSGWPSGPPTCSGRAPRPQAPGLDVSGPDGVIEVDPADPDRRRAGHVHLRGPRRRDAPARADPARRPAAAHDHARRRGHRSRHRVDQLPQRAAARVGARDGRLHRRRRGRHRPARRRTCSTPSPTPTARSATPPGCGSSSSRCRRTSPCATSASTTPACSPRRSRRSSRRASTTAQRVDGLDGVAFAPGEYYLTLAQLDRRRRPRVATTPASSIYYRSIQQRETDLLTIYDYLWRWDTDWFWCSGAFGAQHPVVRRLWPRRWRRSDVYMRLLGLDRRFAIADRLDRRAGRPQRERVIQDVEVPVDRLPEFLDWFDAEIGMRPVWLCPLVARRDWPTYPLEPGRDLRQRRLLGHRPRRPRRPAGAAQPGDRGEGPRARRPQVALLRGVLRPRHLRPALRRRPPGRREAALRPRRPTDHPLRQGGDDETTRQGSSRSPRRSTSLLQEPLPLRFTAYDGSAAGPEDAPYRFHLRDRARPDLPAELARPRPRHGPRLRLRRPAAVRGRAPGRPLRGAGGAPEGPQVPRPTPSELVTLVAVARARRTWCRRPRRRRRHRRGCAGSSRGSGTPWAATPRRSSHHYDVSNRFYELVLGPSMTYTCAVFPTEDATLEEAQAAKYDLVARKLDLQPGQRLLDVGCGWGGMVRHAAKEYGVKALGVTLSRQQADVGAGGDQAAGPRRPGRGAPPRLPAGRGGRLRRGVARSASPSTSGCATTRRTSGSSATS